MAGMNEVEGFREKLDREMKSGVVSLVLLYAIERAGPEYGYRLLKRIHEASAGKLSFKEGTAYPLLQALERMGFVTSYWGDGAGGPPRKYYQITGSGKRALEGALAEWAELNDSVATFMSTLKSEKGRRSP